jgi:hypothetical protein
MAQRTANSLPCSSSICVSCGGEATGTASIRCPTRCRESGRRCADALGRGDIPTEVDAKPAPIAIPTSGGRRQPGVSRRHRRRKPANRRPVATSSSTQAPATKTGRDVGVTPMAPSSTGTPGLGLAAREPHTRRRWARDPPRSDVRCERGWHDAFLASLLRYLPAKCDRDVRVRLTRYWCTFSSMSVRCSDPSAVAVAHGRIRRTLCGRDHSIELRDQELPPNMRKSEPVGRSPVSGRGIPGDGEAAAMRSIARGCVRRITRLTTMPRRHEAAQSWRRFVSSPDHGARQ